MTEAWIFVAKVPFIWVGPGKMVTLPAKPTQVSVCMRQKSWPLYKLQQPSYLNGYLIHPLRMLWLSRFGQFDPSMRAQARLGGWPYHHKRLTQLGKSPFWPLFQPPFFFLILTFHHVFKENVWKVRSPRVVSLVCRWPFNPGQAFSILKGPNFTFYGERLKLKHYRSFEFDVREI